MSDFGFLSTDLCSFDDLDTLLDTNSYPDHIENASEDQMKCWLLEQGYTADELKNYLDSGMSYADLVYSEELRGSYFKSELT